MGQLHLEIVKARATLQSLQVQIEAKRGGDNDDDDELAGVRAAHEAALAAAEDLAKSYSMCVSVDMLQDKAIPMTVHEIAQAYFHCLARVKFLGLIRPAK